VLQGEYRGAVACSTFSWLRGNANGIPERGAYRWLPLWQSRAARWRASGACALCLRAMGRHVGAASRDIVLAGDLVSPGWQRLAPAARRSSGHWLAGLSSEVLWGRPMPIGGCWFGRVRER
jgi:hypothetical protein